MRNFKVTLEYEIAEEIKTPDGENCMASYPNKSTLEVNAPSCMLATTMVIGTMAETFSTHNQFIRIKNTYVQEVF